MTRKRNRANTMCLSVGKKMHLSDIGTSHLERNVRSGNKIPINSICWISWALTGTLTLLYGNKCISRFRTIKSGMGIAMCLTTRKRILLWEFGPLAKDKTWNRGNMIPINPICYISWALTGILTLLYGNKCISHFRTIKSGMGIAMFLTIGMRILLWEFGPISKVKTVNRGNLIPINSIC